MYFYHQPDFYHGYPVSQTMYGSIPNHNSSGHRAYLNTHPYSFDQGFHQTANHPMTHPVLQLPIHPAHLQNRQTERNNRSNNQYQYPPVDPSLFNQSANETKKLMEDASLVLNKLAESKEFDEQLMDFAQRSDMEEVQRLISSVGVKSNVKVNFNPDGFRLVFASNIENTECCQLTINLRWR